ncbi:ATP-binding cassette domain-containing protein [Clostridium akagii]|uniref:ATP-binding cassette domain-containing protein n=1 Tax=Clostridium akagii TaxID=91623 RepID=UPI003BF96E3C
MINEKSSNISGGEKQKISLIRTFIKNADLIILDEPTSALDKNTIVALKKV